jgi:hypothetical protein
MAQRDRLRAVEAAHHVTNHTKAQGGILLARQQRPRRVKRAAVTRAPAATRARPCLLSPRTPCFLCPRPAHLASVYTLSPRTANALKSYVPKTRRPDQLQHSSQSPDQKTTPAKAKGKGREKAIPRNCSHPAVPRRISSEIEPLTIRIGWRRVGACGLCHINITPTLLLRTSIDCILALPVARSRQPSHHHTAHILFF